MVGLSPKSSVQGGVKPPSSLLSDFLNRALIFFESFLTFFTSHSKFFSSQAPDSNNLWFFFILARKCVMVDKSIIWSGLSGAASRLMRAFGV